MEQRFAIRAAGPRDYDAVVAILSAARLPIEGLPASLPGALVAVAPDGGIAGCVAIEFYGPVALLRSLAVASEQRGQGLGEQLAAEALRLAASAGARDVYLLTGTAAGFFPRFGFVREDRSRAPAPIQDSVEFRSACPTTAILMHAAAPA